MTPVATSSAAEAALPGLPPCSAAPTSFSAAVPSAAAVAPRPDAKAVLAVPLASNIGRSYE